MSEFLIAISVGSLVAFILFYNIKEITQKIEKEEDRGHFYSSFSLKIEERLREIREKVQKGILKLKNENLKKEFEDKISDTIRETLLFETIEAKKLNNEKAEERLFKILSNTEEILKKYLKEGEEIADNLREKLYEDYERIKNDIE